MTVFRLKLNEQRKVKRGKFFNKNFALCLLETNSERLFSSGPGLLRVFDLTANKFVYALIAESLSTLQPADTSQALVHPKNISAQKLFT